MLFGRKYRVIVSSNSGSGLDVSGLRCQFEIVKTVQLQTNYSKVTIYNLAAETENHLILEGDRVIIEAGYEDSPQYGCIFDGQILQSIRERDNVVDIKLILTALDGDRYANVNNIVTGLAPKATLREVAEICAGSSRVSAEIGEISESLSNTSLQRGSVYFGSPKDMLYDLAKTNKANLYIDDGKINIINPAELKSGEGFLLTPETGLLGIPNQTQYGVTAKTLLNPRIKLNSTVKIPSQYIRAREYKIDEQFEYIKMPENGEYRVIKITHKGDTRGNDWVTEIEALSMAGNIPALMSGVDSLN